MKKFLLGLIFLIGCGPQGIQGVPGPAGPPGAPGVGCSVSPVTASPSAPNGGSLIACPNSQALVLNGTNGAPGTSVAMVQFCPQYTTNYPSVFPEYGTCVGNSLYAVYWDGKNAWEAMVAPGQYDSTSTSAPCDFTVLANCSIQN